MLSLILFSLSLYLKAFEMRFGTRTSTNAKQEASGFHSMGCNNSGQFWLCCFAVLSWRQ